MKDYQFLLIEIAATLSYNVGQNVSQIDDLLGNIANRAYPNRALDMQMATDNINTEITRSRRYNRPLSVLVFQVNTNIPETNKKFTAIEKDLFLHYTLAKIGKIVDERARQTDLILRDRKQRFVLLCPETGHQASITLGQRIYQIITKEINTEIIWSTASFPEESLTFEELLGKAVSRLSTPDTSTFPSLSYEEKLSN